MVSSHNPFRDPSLTPSTTGVSSGVSISFPSSSSNPPSDPIDNNVSSQTSYLPPSVPPPGNNERARSPLSGSVNDILSEELPPAYTPAPNVYEGESTLELGPRRPFLQSVAVSHPNQAQFPPQSWGMTPQSTGASTWSSFPEGRTFAPPPSHPASQVRAARPLSTSNGPISDFARDFYAAGSGDTALYGGPSGQYRGDSPGTSPTSQSSGEGSGPPSGEPSNRGKTAPSSPTHNGVADDGRPTDHPVPGHPLLRHGKVLVYPNGFECQKCRNTGYKNYDPSHPCARCWEKYAKPYAGAIVYAPWTSDGPSSASGSSSSSSSNFQRPLPVFRAPQSSLLGHHQSASWSAPASGLSRSATTASRPPQSQTQSYGGGYPGSSARVIPIAGGAMPMSSYLDRLGTGVRGRTVFPPPSWLPSGQLSSVPPSSGNVAVYPPGDPRIGGRLCWRCGGRGKTSFLIFDEETCSICDGVGRTFV